MTEKLRRRARPLLVVSAGLAIVTFGGSGCFTSGNLVVRPCVEEDGGPCTPENETVDAGTSDGGTPDGGVLGGDQ